MKIKKMLLPTVIGVLPIIIGLLLYNKLPEKLPIHWGLNGQADQSAPKLLAIFFLPMLMIIANYLTQFSLQNSEKSNPKLERLLIWLFPILSLVLQSITFSNVLGYNISVIMVMMLSIGLMFMILGNYIPKTSQNRRIGFRFPTTVSNLDNWQKTNRLGGRMLVLSGVIFLLTSIISLWYPIILIIVLVITFILILIVPLVYSLALSKK